MAQFILNNIHTIALILGLFFICFSMFLIGLFWGMLSIGISLVGLALLIDEEGR